MTNEHPVSITLVLLLTATALPGQTPQLKAAAISAGAARLDNGSIVNIGQPLVGMFGTPGAGVVGSAGFLSMIRPPFASPPPVVNGGYGWVAGSFNLSFAAQAGGSYGVEASTNLVDWSRIWSTNASGVSVFFTDPQAWQFNRRFYRVVAP